MKKIILHTVSVLIISGLSINASKAQNVGINTLNPDASSILDITHTTRGLLIPRVQLIASNNAAPIVAPALSLLVFNLLPAGVIPNNVKTGYYYWDGTKWTGIGTSNAWDLLGNAGTNASINFIGTTDAQDLVIRTNNTERMRLLSTGNVGIGTNAPLTPLHLIGNLTTSNPAQNLNLSLTPDFFGSSYIQAYQSTGVFTPLIIDGAGITLRGQGFTNILLNPLSGGNVGIGTATPLNKLEITQGTAGNSGLRFTNLLNAGALSTNATGDVIPTTLNPANALYWGLTGNSGTTPATNFLGTSDAQDFVTRTNNIERMRVLSNGYVGVGTATAARQLEVINHLRVSSSNPFFELNGTFAPIPNLATFTVRSAGEVVQRSNTNNLAISDWEVKYGTGTNAFPNDQFYIARKADPTTANDYFMNINSVGNVGIGTITPTAKLEVKDNINRRTLNIEHDFSGLSNTDAAFIGGVDVGFTSTGLFVVQKDAISLGSTGSNLINVVSNSVSKMVVNGIGNVGIGNATPIYKLDIVTSDLSLPAGYGRALKLKATFPAMEFEGTGGGANKSGFITYDSQVTGPNPAGMKFFVDETPNTLSPTTPILTLKSNQNVGIGNSLPSNSAKLDVASTTAGFAMPRMTSAQRKAIVAPIAGLQVYDTDLKGYYYFDGAIWDCVSVSAGTVNYFANATAPHGYLECNGQSVSTTTYTELFTAIGYLYGGAGASFNVPDLRGEFVRGVDNGRGADPLRLIGSPQKASALRSETGNIGCAVIGGVDLEPTYTTPWAGGGGGATGGSCTPGTFTWLPVRPRNVAMLPCIKF